MHYIYKITNKINGKYYIGKRKHVLPERDMYMGSGKQIKAAIKKYGVENFKKEIIFVVDTDVAASNIEKTIVNEKLLSDPNCYNMRKGGNGGFEHINHLPIESRPNIKKIRKMIEDGSLSCGGSKNWSCETKKKIIENLKRNTLRYSDLTEEQKTKRNKKISEKNKGKRAHNYNHKIYVPKNFKPPISPKIIHHYSFIPGQQPSNYIPYSDILDAQKSKTGSYGTRWIFNENLKKNKLINKNNEIPTGWQKGRKTEFYKK